VPKTTPIKTSLGARAQTLSRLFNLREGFTADDVRDGFARYDRPEARLRFVITPK
jgi:hypothetical protein